MLNNQILSPPLQVGIQEYIPVIIGSQYFHQPINIYIIFYVVLLKDTLLIESLKLKSRPTVL